MCRVRWRVMVPVALLVLLATPVGYAQSTAMVFAGCRLPNLHLLNHRPYVERLPHGGRLRIWDTGRRRNRMAEMRVSEVFVPRSSSLHLSFLTSGALTRSKLPQQVMVGHPNAVAVTNADVFDPARGSLPVGAEVLNGRVVKARRSMQYVVAIARNGRVSGAHLRLVGSVLARRHQVPVTGLNWQHLAGAGVNVYASPWGYGRRPHGRVDVLVRHGRVRLVMRGHRRGRPPRGGQRILTAGAGPAARFLSHLHRGERIRVRYGFDSPNAPFTIQQAVSHGAPFLQAGRRWPVRCSFRNEQLRPRTAIGWDAQGNIMLVTVSGRAVKHGMLYGGSTLRNMEFYLQQLGAYNALAMDGGGSTALVVRRHLHARPHRIDRPGTRQRPVPTFLAVVG